MKFRIILFVAGLLTWGCRNREELIVGSWKIDSVYTYYNGYGTMENDSLDLERYIYGPNDELSVNWMGTSKQMSYKLTGSDTLLYFENGREASRYLVMGLDSKHLVLKKTKLPLFGGKGQERYEVRYFSRIK